MRTSPRIFFLLAVCVALVRGVSIGGEGEERMATEVHVTSSGPIQGYRVQAVEEDTESSVSVDVFRGIPFASPPTGENRWRAPQPVEAWEDVRKSILPGKPCPQLRIAGPLMLGDEDCLYLNVYKPSNATKDSKLPMLFWIFGGGYVLGDGFEFGLYDGSHLASKYNMVVVAANYRLGALGFMASDELKKEDPNNSTGNYATQDQRAALLWARKNADVFGFDVDKITIAGESAGAFSVVWHLVSEKSKGLFSQAILESGTNALTWFFQPYNKAKTFYNEMSGIWGCNMTDGKKRLECLRKIPAHKLVISVAEYYRDTTSRDHKLLPISGDIPAYGPSLFPIMPYGPTIDESEEGLLGVPVELMEAGRANFVPIILGANKNGGNLILDSFIAEIVPGTKLPADNATVRRALDWFLKNDSKTAQELYSYDEYKSDKQPDTQRIADLLRDCTFQCPNRRMARIWSQHGQPTYLYTFSYDLGPVDRYVHGGDFHASELPFVFGNYLWALSLIGVPAPKKISEDIQSRWTSFVKYGSPNNNSNSNNSRNGSQNTNSNVYWPRFDENSSFSGTGGQYMSLKLPNSVKSLRADNMYPDNEFPSALKCDFWDKQKLEWEELRQHPEKID